MGHFLLLPQSQSSELSSPGSNTVTYTVSSLPQALQNLFLSIHVYTPAPTLVFATTTLVLFHDSSPLHCCGSCCLLRFILAILKGLEKQREGKNTRTVKRAPPFRRKRLLCNLFCWEGNALSWSLWSPRWFPFLSSLTSPRLRACCVYYISSSGFVPL